LTIPTFLDIKHRECEYAIPVAKRAAALQATQPMLEENDFSTTLPIEIRFVAGDDSWLSPATGTGDGVCYIGANTDRNANEVFQQFEPMMKELGGRPHWGKHFTMTREEIVRMYPDYKRFSDLRSQLDPQNVFQNSLIHHLFGS